MSDPDANATHHIGVTHFEDEPWLRRVPSTWRFERSSIGSSAKTQPVLAVARFQLGDKKGRLGRYVAWHHARATGKAIKLLQRAEEALEVLEDAVGHGEAEGDRDGSKGQGGKGNDPITTFTTGQLGKEIGITAETVRTAMHKAKLTPNKRGDRTPSIGPREVSLIATARQQMGAKDDELDKWRALIQRIEAPKFGSRPKAKPKTNPNPAS
jgi:hypothetical protein